MNKVIFAEDDGTLRESICDYLNYFVEGIQAEAVATGDELVEKVRNGSYLVIFTDNEMLPGISGLEAIRKIREFDKNTLIYMLAGSSVEKQALELGANGYLEKSKGGAKEIKDVIEEIIKSKK